MSPPENPDLNMSLLPQPINQDKSQQKGNESAQPQESNAPASFSNHSKTLPPIFNHDLAGIAQLASNNLQQGQPSSTKPAQEERPQPSSQQSQDTGITPVPNPAETLFKLPMSRPQDAPKLPEQRRDRENHPQAQLPSISTALDQHDKSTPMSGVSFATASPQSATSQLHTGFTPTPVSATRAGEFPLQSPSQFNLPPTTTPTSPFPPLATPTSATSTTAPGSANRRHTCPHCNQTFTRVHNLKSHLLTHSKSKPFDCTSCPAKFRRLHDLKRHTRLHTGERPHECNKCGRKFARGDALARHARGESGCAGRRSSVAGNNQHQQGSFDEQDEEYDDYSESPDVHMGGMDSSNSNAPQIPQPSSAGSDSERRRASLPSIRTDLSRQPNPPTPGYLQHHTTYPPAGMISRKAPNANATRSPKPHHQQPTPATPSSGAHLPSLHHQSFITSTITSSPRPHSPPILPVINPTSVAHGQPTPISAVPPGMEKNDGWQSVTVYIRTLEERVKMLEEKVRGLEQREREKEQREAR